MHHGLLPRRPKASVLVGGREQAIANPKDAHALGLGMVYQHFTLVPAMTVAENLVLARDDVPAVVDWTKEKKELAAFLATDAVQGAARRAGVRHLSAGERQKCEILKQLYLKRKLSDPRRADLGADARRGRRGARHAARHGGARTSSPS